MTGLKGSILKNKIASGEQLLGTLAGISDPLVARMFTQLGFDFLLIDMEHTRDERRDAASHLADLRRYGCLPDCARSLA